jgi:hypothetical protein
MPSLLLWMLPQVHISQVELQARALPGGRQRGLGHVVVAFTEKQLDKLQAH